MKKTNLTKISFSFIILFVFSFILIGCDNESHTHSNESHVHNYTNQIVKTDYLRTAASCSKKAVYYYTCDCGKIGTQVFEYGELDPDNHLFNQCNASQRYLKREASCTNKAEYYYSCICGEIGTLTFEYGNLKEHKFNTYSIKYAATCTSDEIQISTCEECTATDIKTISGTKLQHFFDKSVCIYCDFSFLNFTLNNDNTYCVNGVNNEFSETQEIEIPSTYKNLSVSSIADYAFNNCTHLRKLILNDGITAIGKESFKNCYSLSSIIIPKTINSIGNHAFDNCYRLVEVYNLSALDISAGSSSYGGVGLYALEVHNSKASLSNIEQVDDYLFWRGENNYLIDYIGNSNSIVLPDSYEQKYYEIMDFALFNKATLTQIVVSNKVTRIGFSAFADCNNLTKLSIPFIGESRDCEQNNYFGHIFGDSSRDGNYRVIPKTLTHLCLTDEKVIPNNAFADCSNIQSITLNDGLQETRESAFYNCKSLLNISIPNSVISIGTMAFYYTPLYDDNNWEDDVLYIDNCLIKAKSSVIGKYNIKSETRLIADGAFNSCAKITEVILPSNIKYLPYALFYGCKALKNVRIPNSVIWIGGSAFYGCESLTDIIIPNNVVYIGDSAFSGCIALNNIILPTKLNAIADSMFYECNRLENIIIPQSVKSIGQYAFYGCTYLNNIIIPNGITKICAMAFYGCSSIETILIPTSVVEIGQAAFIGCFKLSNATFESTHGWVLCAAVGTSTTKIELSANDIANTAKAAEYLISTTYSQFFIWKRSDSDTIKSNI